MQVTLQPLNLREGSSVQVDTTPQATVATLISTYCTQKGISFDRQLVLFDGRRRPLPQFSTLTSLGITHGQSLLIGYHEPAFSLSERWPIIVALVALIIGLVGIVTLSMVYGLSGGKYPDDYGVVMDAGSSKTNTILYSWKSNKHRGTGCVSQETNCKADGGIAEKDPMELDEIIECAGNVTLIVPEKVRPKTSLFFAATAGMRLLNLTNPTRATEILDQLHSELNKTGLSVKVIEMISGRDEGIYGWITANFLEQTLELPQKTNPWKPTTYGALDMGGASMQIAYALPVKIENVTSIVSLKLYGQTHHVLSESNLCFGRDEAERRYRFLLTYKNPKKTSIEDPCLPLGYIYNITGANLFGRPCTRSEPFAELLAKDKSIMSTTYNFVGTSSSQYCAGNVSLLLDTNLCKELKFKECFEKKDDIPDDQLYLAFATYFYTTSFLNVTESSLEEYENATEVFCAKTYDEVNLVTNNKFRTQYCFNGKYIYTVLTRGFYFDSKTWKNIRFVSTIAGKDVGWTLGYMVNATNFIPTQKPLPRLISTAALTICLILFILIIIGTIIFVYHHHNGKNASGKLNF